MKKILYMFTVVATVLLVSCKGAKTDGESSNQIVQNDKLGQFDFMIDEYDFGKIIQGEKVSYSFKFKNVGSQNLIISDAKGSCGCTVPEYSNKPIAPGESGIVDVIFDSTGKSGKQRKTVTLTANTEPANFNLIIKGEVISSDKDSQ